MRTASGALAAYLAITDQIDVADLLTITLANGGGTVRLTTYDEDLLVAGNAYSAGPTIYRRDLVKVAVGLVADPITLTISPAADALLGGVSWQAAAQQGLFDGARVSVDKVFMPEPGDTSLGLVNLFAGRVADVDADRVSIELTCKSDVELLDTPFPRNLYQPTCDHTLFDSGARCSRRVHDRDGGGDRIDGEDPERLGLTQPTGYYDLGTVTMTSGALAGQTAADQGVHARGRRARSSSCAPSPPRRRRATRWTSRPGCDKRRPRAHEVLEPRALPRPAVHPGAGAGPVTAPRSLASARPSSPRRARGSARRTTSARSSRASASTARSCSSPCTSRSASSRTCARAVQHAVVPPPDGGALPRRRRGLLPSRRRTARRGRAGRHPALSLRPRRLARRDRRR
jgi:hypothetical protein